MKVKELRDFLDKFADDDTPVYIRSGKYWIPTVTLRYLPADPDIHQRKSLEIIDTRRELGVLRSNYLHLREGLLRLIEETKRCSESDEE